jgi:hypothetical protein
MASCLDHLSVRVMREPGADFIAVTNLPLSDSAPLGRYLLQMPNFFSMPSALMCNLLVAG